MYTHHTYAHTYIYIYIYIYIHIYSRLRNNSGRGVNLAKLFRGAPERFLRICSGGWNLECAAPNISGGWIKPVWESWPIHPTRLFRGAECEKSVSLFRG